MHTYEPHDGAEGRRIRGWALHLHGWRQTKIAAALGVTQGAVSRWIARGTEGGLGALRTKKAPGAPPR